MSASKKKQTGIGEGVNAFFKRSGGTNAPKQPTEPVREKSRTTVMLYNDTLEMIELLKAQSRKQGVKATMSDILNDAVELLAKERSLSQ